MKKVNIYSFKNKNTDKTTNLVSGFNENGDPCYQIDSKEIPITGEFTGFPITIMIAWFKSIGYEFTGMTKIDIKTNVFRNGYFPRNCR